MGISDEFAQTIYLGVYLLEELISRHRARQTVKAAHFAITEFYDRMARTYADLKTCVNEVYQCLVQHALFIFCELSAFPRNEDSQMSGIDPKEKSMIESVRCG
jgi:hypothetical protein